MSELVTIRPRQGSRKFTAIEGVMSQFSLIKEGDKESFKDSGQYKRERFPSSRQIRRIKWSDSKRMWMLRGYEKMTTELQERLNTLVSKCKLKYPDSHPKRRQYIDEADVYDRRDPFFTHNEVRLILKEGETVIDKSRPLENIMLMGLEACGDFMVGGESVNPLMSTRVRYVIIDRNIDSKAKKSTRDVTTKAVKLNDALDDAKKIKVALALQVITDDTVDRALIDELLWEYLQDTTTKVTDNMTKQEFFIYVCESDSEDLELRTLITKSKKEGILRYQRNAGWLLFGANIARNESAVFEYLKDPDNHEVVTRIEHVLKNGK